MPRFTANKTIGATRVSLLLAYKSVVKGNRWVPIMLVLVMAFSFINVIFASSILRGVMVTMDEQQVNTLRGNVVICPEDTDYYLDHVSHVVSMASQVPGVVAASPHLNDAAFMEYQWKEKLSPSDKGDSGTWQVIGVDPDRERQVTTIPDSVIAGSYLDEGDRDSIVLGVEIAGGDSSQTSPFLTLGDVHIGDKVRLTYTSGLSREYTVKGIFRARDMEADRQAFVTRNEMISVLGRSGHFDRASQILVKTADGVAEEDVISQFEAMGIPGEMRSWHEYGGAVRGVISTFDIVTALISSASLMVATIVMFIVIYISVLSKRHQIGILRAIGIQRRTIIGSYMAQALFYAVAGIASGWLLMRFVLVPYFQYHPLDLAMGMASLHVTPAMLETAIFGVLVAAILAGFLPAWFILKQGIIRTIWGD